MKDEEPRVWASAMGELWTLGKENSHVYHDPDTNWAFQSLNKGDIIFVLESSNGPWVKVLCRYGTVYMWYPRGNLETNI